MHVLERGKKATTKSHHSCRRTRNGTSGARRDVETEIKEVQHTSNSSQNRQWGNCQVPKVVSLPWTPLHCRLGSDKHSLSWGDLDEKCCSIEEPCGSSWLLIPAASIHRDSSFILKNKQLRTFSQNREKCRFVPGRARRPSADFSSAATDARKWWDAVSNVLRERAVDSEFWRQGNRHSKLGCL